MRGLFGEEIDDRPSPAAPPPQQRAGGRYVRVAVERSIDGKRPAGPKSSAADEGALTYWTDAPVAIGDRVEVPLGRGNTPTSGIVIDVGGDELLAGADGSPAIDPRRVKAVLSVTGSRLPSRLVDLARWMSTYYICPLGMVLATMMPAAVKHGTGKRTRTLLARVGGDHDLSALTPSARKAWEAIAALPDSLFPIDPRALANTIASPTLAPINRLLRAGLLKTVERDEIVAPPTLSLAPGVLPMLDATSPLPTLTPAQARAVSGIAAALGSFSVHLLRGVTGSGKTEVYLRLIAEVLSRGKTALVLVPEISLTPQTAGRFEARFGHNTVAVLHSGLSASQRHRQWAGAAAGRARVVVGARSAVFAPLADLGLIVVDEEHDHSYKQDQLPRYHGRDVAIKRAHLENCPVVLGSATPSLESWANVADTRRGAARYRLWELPDRVAGAGTLPKVELVDAADQRRRVAAEGKRPGLIGPTLASALRKVLTDPDGGQAILLLNRRGFASYIACHSAACGWSFQCDSCDASMIHHRHDPLRPGGYVRCHHCLAEQRLPSACPLCQGKVGLLGAGTQRVEEELARDFGLIVGDNLLRVDSDTMRTARDYFNALSAFGEGRVRVLLGTQMIAKGLDYPNVRLVGVIDGDTALSLPDFRAAERTFQLISQVAGRAGRGAAGGRVIVQTLNPDMPCIRLAAQHDYVTFANEELTIRRRSGLPPATRMARIVVRDEDAAEAQRLASLIADRLRAAAQSTPRGNTVRIEGPAPCPISRIAGYHRFGIELTSPDRPALQAVLAAVRAEGHLKSDAHTAIDVDPISLM